MDTVSSNLTHHFLIAMPHMVDPRFSRTLTYIAEHNEQGALGVIVNRPLDMTLGTLFERVDVALDAVAQQYFSAQPVYFGGPVQTDRGFVLHRPSGQWHSTLKVNDDVGFTSSRDILQAIGMTGEPHDVLVSLGFAAWAAGQLEQELVDNAWLTIPADMAIVFDLPPEDRLSAAMHTLGIDFTQLSEVAGHA
ncbi:MAG: YqgE/AlgH family protein [Azoarcus sp.]|jgi:putative transcriptional regulator|nr:YqgE/AlgH family protein [Azoarcus sp.]